MNPCESLDMTTVLCLGTGATIGFMDLGAEHAREPWLGGVPGVISVSSVWFIRMSTQK